MYYKYTDHYLLSILSKLNSEGKQPVLLKICIIKQESYSKHQL